MYKNTYFTGLCSYTKIVIMFSGTFYKTVWAAKPSKILNIRRGLNIDDSVLSHICLTANINKAKLFLKRTQYSQLKSEYLTLNYSLDP